MRIRAFHGLRFNGTEDEAGALAAPPYDQIDDARRDDFHTIDGHFVHLTCPVAQGTLDAHQNSADLHRRWLASGRVTRDAEPTLYANTIELPGGTVRYGLTALIDVESDESGIVRPHEETVAKTIAERQGLLRTTRIDYEPILLLAEDGGALDHLLAEDCRDATALATHRDEFGNLHRLFAIQGEARRERYRRALADSAGLIADGHHRYKTARLHAGEIGAARGSAAAAKLSVITSLDSRSLAIDPIHRVLPRTPDLDAISALVVARERLRAESGSALAAAVADAPGTTLAVLTGDGDAALLTLDSEQGPPELPRAASDLAVVLLHASLLPAWGYPPTAATDGTIGYRSDPGDLWRAVVGGEFPTGIVLPPMTADAFAGAIADGDVLPPKSTRFLPKVVSGLVWASHDDPIG